MISSETGMMIQAYKTGIQTIKPVELKAHHELRYTISGEIYFNARMKIPGLDSNLKNN
jgi:hypothetical protein